MPGDASGRGPDRPSAPSPPARTLSGVTPEAFATARHEGQTRKGGDLPYIVHPRGVAALLAFHYPGQPDLEAAGWLHDTLEDTPTTPQELGRLFGPEVRRLVEAVTRRDGMPFEPPSEAQAMRLKVADALDNITFTIAELRSGVDVFVRFRDGRGKIPYWRGIADAAADLLGREPIVARLIAAVDEVTRLADGV
jgi:hypothetical protein